MNNKACILLAVFNGAKYLDEQIKSLLQQTYNNFDIIISDDGSSDESINIIASYIKLYSNVKLLPFSCATGSPAGNFFKLIIEIDLSEYEFIALSDQDDIWFPSKLSHAIDCINKEKVNGYSSDLICFSEDNEKIWTTKKNSIQKKYDYLFQGASAGCTYVMTLGAALVVKEALANVDKRVLREISHDWLIYGIIRSNCMGWFHDKVPTILYRQHINNAYSALPGLSGIKVKLSLIRNGWLLKQILLLEPFIKKDSFIKIFFIRLKRLGFIDRLWMIKNARLFRRNSRDVVVIILIFIFGII